MAYMNVAEIETAIEALVAPTLHPQRLELRHLSHAQNRRAEDRHAGIAASCSPGRLHAREWVPPDLDDRAQC